LIGGGFMAGSSAEDDLSIPSPTLPRFGLWRHFLNDIRRLGGSKSPLFLRAKRRVAPTEGSGHSSSRLYDLRYWRASVAQIAWNFRG